VPSSSTSGSSTALNSSTETTSYPRTTAARSDEQSSDWLGLIGLSGLIGLANLFRSKRAESVGESNDAVDHSSQY
jgi:hypothetical protein